MTTHAFSLRIVGMHHHGGLDLWNALASGTLDRIVQVDAEDFVPLKLRPEPTNRNDPNAIEIVVPASASLNGADIKLGYLPRQLAEKTHDLIAAAGHIDIVLDTRELEEPGDGTLWRGALHTDAAAIAEQCMRKTKGRVPTSWQTTPPKPRPKTRKKLVHGWF